jgi:hypothetical protein
MSGRQSRGEEPAKPKMEAKPPGFFSRYRWFWSSCEWEVFLRPNSKGLEVAKKDYVVQDMVTKLLHQPGGRQGARQQCHRKGARIPNPSSDPHIPVHVDPRTERMVVVQAFMNLH